MNPATAESPVISARTRWSRRKLLLFVALALAVHVVLIFIFGTRKPVQPRPVANVPQFQMADNASELVALDDPTLFALPHMNDFSAVVWLKTPAIQQPSFRWTEEPQTLPLAAENLGAAFASFMQSNHPAAPVFDFKPQPAVSQVALPPGPALGEHSTLRITGDLARRPLLHRIVPPALPCDDLIAPSKIQALVDEAGNVISEVPLAVDNSLEAAAHNDTADQLALQLARQLRFAPAPRLTFGEIIFHWRTVPVASTNAP